jgi:hypothetical protein
MSLLGIDERGEIPVEAVVTMLAADAMVMVMMAGLPHSDVVKALTAHQCT